MNVKTDFIPFCELWTATHDIMPAGKVFKQHHMEIIFKDLITFDFEIVRQAINHHRRTKKFAPAPYDIIELISKTRPQHIGAEEAWSIANALYDEGATVCITDEIIAAYSASSAVLDKVAARMIFKEKYSELIKNANPPRWWVSIGTDKDKRAGVIQEAVTQGRLQSDSVKKLLGYDAVQAEPTADGIENLKKIRALLYDLNQKTRREIAIENCEKNRVAILEAAKGGAV
jgi:hypothetical protein